MVVGNSKQPTNQATARLNSMSYCLVINFIFTVLPPPFYFGGVYKINKVLMAAVVAWLFLSQSCFQSDCRQSEFIRPSFLLLLLQVYLDYKLLSRLYLVAIHFKQFQEEEEEDGSFVVKRRRTLCLFLPYRRSAFCYALVDSRAQGEQ